MTDEAGRGERSFDAMLARLSRAPIEGTIAEPLVEALRALDPPTMEDGDFAPLERIAQAFVGAINHELAHRDGWQIRAWDSRGPQDPPEKNLLHGRQYRLVHPEREDELYVLEPYELDDETAAAILALAREQGWRVQFRSWGALHFPGHTLCVTFRRHAPLEQAVGPFRLR